MTDEFGAHAWTLATYQGVVFRPSFLTLYAVRVRYDPPTTEIANPIIKLGPAVHGMGAPQEGLLALGAGWSTIRKHPSSHVRTRV